MMKNIKHNVAQVAAPSNLSLSRGDRFLRVCAWETSSARTMKHLLAPLRVWMQRIPMIKVGRDKRKS